MNISMEDGQHIQDEHLIVGVGGEDDEQLGGCVVGVDLSVDVDGVCSPMERGGEVFAAKVLINERSLRRKSEDDVLDDRRLVVGLFFDACRDILRFTTLGFYELKGVRVSGQRNPPPVSCHIVKRHQSDGRSRYAACFRFRSHHPDL